MSASKIINTLWPDVAKHLTDEQLGQLTHAEDLNIAMRNAAEVLMGIGCLVAEDGLHEDSAGSFQDADSVPRLLCFFSDFISGAAAAYRVVDDATTILHERQMERATKQQAREVESPS